MMLRDRCPMGLADYLTLAMSLPLVEGVVDKIRAPSFVYSTGSMSQGGKWCCV